MEEIAYKMVEWFLENSEEMEVYELEVSGHATNAATALASLGLWSRAALLLQTAIDLSKKDIRPLIRLSAVQLKLHEYEKLHGTVAAIRHLKRGLARDPDSADVHLASYLEIYRQVKRSMPRIPLLSMPTDLFKGASSDPAHGCLLTIIHFRFDVVVLDQLKDPLDLWAEPIRQLAVTCSRAHQKCSKYLTAFYKAQALRILSHSSCGALLDVANAQRDANWQYEATGFRRVIQDHSEVPMLKEIFGAYAPRTGLDKYILRPKLGELSLEGLAGGLPTKWEWEQDVRYCSSLLQRFELIPAFLKSRILQTSAEVPTLLVLVAFDQDCTASFSCLTGYDRSNVPGFTVPGDPSWDRSSSNRYSLGDGRVG